MKMIGVFVDRHKGEVSRLISAWTVLLHTFFGSYFPPPTRADIEACTPSKLRHKGGFFHYILDATEIKMEAPSAHTQRKITHSNYKGCATAKMIVAITASGDVAFVSNAYPGYASDDFVVRDSGLVEEFGPGCVYMGDKGFTDHAHYVGKGCQLITPPRAFQGQKRLTNQMAVAQREICTKRIHVERVFGAIKTKWRVFRGVLPMHVARDVDIIFRVCAHLTSLSRTPFCAYASTLMEEADSSAAPQNEEDDDDE